MPIPARVEDVDAWGASLGEILARHAAAITILEVLVGDQPVAVASYAVRVASTAARATTAATIRLAIGGSRMVGEASRSAIYTDDLVPYIDLLAIPAAEAERATSWLRGGSAGAVVTLSTGPNLSRTGAVMDEILRARAPRSSFCARADKRDSVARGRLGRRAADHDISPSMKRLRRHDAGQEAT